MSKNVLECSRKESYIDDFLDKKYEGKGEFGYIDLSENNKNYDTEGHSCRMRREDKENWVIVVDEDFGDGSLNVVCIWLKLLVINQLTEHWLIDKKTSSSRIIKNNIFDNLKRKRVGKINC